VSGTVAPFRVWWDAAARIVRVEWRPGTRGDLEAARAATAAVRDLGVGPVPMLIDIRGVAALDREGRAHFREDYAGASRVALLAGSAVNRMLANFFIGMQRLPVPIRMFTDEAAAVAWLREQQ
jgi:hypothetical protein